MHPLVTVLVHVFALAGSSLVAAIWEGSVIAAAVAVGLRLLPGIPARARTVIWLAVMVLVSLLPFVGSRQSGVAGPEARVGLGWTFGLAAVWVGLSVVRAVRLVWSAALLRGISRRAVPIAVPEEITALLDGKVELCASDEVSVPSVAGFFAPRILLPAELVERLSSGDLRQIVVHEMEHLRRKDDWTNLLQKVTLVVFPLNPVLLWVERRLCADRELACDDAVLRATGSPKAYASCLANLAEYRLVQRGVSLALGAWERRPELARRVQRILARPEIEMRQTRGLVAGMLVGIAVAAVALSRTPQMVQFAAELPFVAEVPVELPMTRTVASGSPARMVMAMAKMPVERVVATRVSGKRVHHVVVSGKAGKHSRVYSAPWYVLTKAEEGNAAKFVDLGFAESSRFSYAAVPLRNGWLIIQL